MNAFTYYSELVAWLLSHVSDSDMFLVQSVVTCGALFWLLHRAWLTLWKPVPELINILGVEVPDPPAVSLAGIKADAVTLHWTRPGVNRPVLKYLIQVNGVNVGDSSRLETAITITGLKPSHFYNVRVIAVGNNNFQAASRVIRLKTYGRDGRPDLGSSRSPANLPVEDLQNGTLIDSSDDSVGVRSHGAVVETAPSEGSLSVTRDQGSSHIGQRRNTGGRRYSPSTASENPTPPNMLSNGTDETMQHLAERFEMIRGETEEVIAQVSKDAEDFRLQMSDLSRERDEKRQVLKEKEEASEKLRKEAHYSERSNRQAQNRKSQKEKILREKQAERTKMLEDIARWQQETEDMRKEEESWKKEKEKITKVTEKKIDELRGTVRKRQSSLNSMEEVIRIKGLQIKELEERQKLPGAEDSEESKERNVIERQRDIQWEQKERDLIARSNNSATIFRNLESDIQTAQAYLTQLSARRASNPVLYNGNSSGVDFDNSGQGRTKSRRGRQRRSRTSTISSPITVHPIIDSSFPSANTYNNITSTSTAFAPGPYFDMSANMGLTQLSGHSGMSDADMRSLTAGAPLSPTATSLLPSNIFADDEPPHHSSSFGPLFVGMGSSVFENDPQSPASSSRSASLISSPRTSSHNLPLFPPIREAGGATDRRSIHSAAAEFGVIGVIGSPNISTAQPAPPRRFGDLFNLSRQRGKNMQDDGPILGSLKPGQSQSFPRQGDEPESLAMRNRRTSFSTSWAGLPFLNRSGTAGEVTEGNGPAPARNAARKRRGFNMFGSSYDDPISERDPSSPRPASIASSDLPRPSTDSAPFGWPAADNLAVNRNSPLATNWSIGLSQPWSRNSSRRPSAQHSSTSALPTGIVADDDEFLPPDTLTQQSSPPQVGVIGTRPQSSKSTTAPKLNPNAPTFKVMFSRSSKTEKDRSDKLEKPRGKGRPRRNTDSTDDHGAADDSSPSDSRKSRDTRSIHTLSVTESHESLDRTVSNTPSETINAKDGKENSFQRLLRKGSSSKFSISSFRGKESLFGGKKGNAANSDRNVSDDRSSNFGDMEESGEDSHLGMSTDSITSSPQVGSGTLKEGRMGVNWGRFGLKKGKGGRASMESGERASETDGTEDERDG